MINVLLSALFGVLEGVSEWLPISSTGHLILLRRFVRFPVRDEFFELFQVVIQLGAILAVAVLFFDKLNPFSRRKSRAERAATWRLWYLVLLAALPSAVLGFLFDDWLDAHLYRPTVVAGTLILYGVLFIVIEKTRKSAPFMGQTEQITPKTALLVGGFQVLSLVPGTSRSGATVLGGILAGLARTVAAEFSFFLGLPTMLGATVLKTGKFCLEGHTLSGEEWLMLAVGTLTAFLVSLAVIRALLDFVRRHTFAAFGVYRILLGAAVLATLFIN